MRTSCKHFAAALVCMLLAPLVNGRLWAQDETPKTVTDQNRVGDLPFSTSLGVDAESVDIGTGHVSIRVPFVTIKGRGMDYNFGLRYNSGFLIVGLRAVPSGTYAVWNIEKRNYVPDSGLGWEPTQPRVTSTSWVENCGPPAGTDLHRDSYIFYDPEGGRHPLELESQNAACTWYTAPPMIDQGGFQSATLSGPDSSGAGIWATTTADSQDAAIQLANGTSVGATGTTTSSFQGSTWAHDYQTLHGNYVDRNGNQMGGYAGGLDTLGRTIVTSTPGSNQIQYSIYDSGGTPRTYTVQYAPVSVLTAFNTQYPPWGYILEYSGTRYAITSIVLPNGRSYAFQYETNGYGGLSRIDLPTGASITYGWATFSNNEKTYRYVANRTLTVGGQNYTWTFTRACIPPYCDSVTVTVTDPLQHQTVYTAQDGTITSAKFYDGAAGGTAVRQHTIDYMSLYGYRQPNIVSGRLPTAITTTLDNGLVGRTEYDYETFTYNYQTCWSAAGCAMASQLYGDGTEHGTGTASRGNITEIREYDWGQGAPGPLLRKTTKQYLHNANTTYKNYNIVDRVLSDYMYDGSDLVNPKGKTEFDYDNGNSAYASPTGNAPQHDYVNFSSSFTYRGNVTKVRRWRNTDNTWIPTVYAYDDLGNIRSIADPLGHTTSWDYTDRWSGTSCLPAANSLAYPTQMTNALNQRVQFTIFPCTGLRQARKDENDLANGTATTYVYDLLARLTQKNLPDGGQVATCFSDTPGAPCYDPALPVTITATTQITSLVSQVSVTKQDGLNRVVQTQLTSDPDGPVKVDTTYDALGRTASQSNPYRGQAPDGTTWFAYDALGRQQMITRQDGGIVSTLYVGNATTVTDEAGKQRRSYADALGRLIRVDEPFATSTSPASGAVTIGGQLQSGAFSTPGTGSVTISGSEGSITTDVRYCAQYNTAHPPGCVDWESEQQTTYDSGSVAVTVNGFSKTVAYGSSSTAASLASALASAFNSDSGSPVTASASAAVLYLTSKQTGSGTNYSLSASSATSDPTDFSGPSFTAGPSGSTLTGGQSNAQMYDAGSVWMTVAGFTATTNYGQGSTSSSVAGALAQILNTNSSSPVTASLNGAVINMISKQSGLASDYSLSSGSSTTQSNYFSQPSFTATASGSNLTGGSDGNPLDVPASTFYTYDVLNNLTQVQQRGGTTDSTQWRVRNFTYDSLSQLVAASNPESGTITYSYNNDGVLTSKQDQRGITITYPPPDPLHRMTGKSYSNGDPAVSYTYDQTNCLGQSPCANIGRRTGMSDASGTAAWAYDPMGRAKIEHRTIGVLTPKDTVYTYNLDGSVATLKYPSQRLLTYTPGGAGRPLAAGDSSNNYVTSATYAPHGALAGMINGKTSGFTGITTSNSYNNRLQPITLSASAPSQTVLSLTYDFHRTTGDNGNVFGITNGRDSLRALVGSATYVYDALNRIQSAATTGTDCTMVNGFSKNWGESYTTDPWGNLTDITPSKCSAENLHAAPATKNQLSGYCYDAAGNLTGVPPCPASTYVYDAENRVKSTMGINYTYDGDGKRVKKDSGKLYWTGTGSDPLTETDLSGNPTADYVFFNGERIARVDLPSGTVHYYFKDNLGSARVITNATGSIEQESDYYPYGGERALSPGPNNYKFTSKERDSESGLDNFGARYNASTMGRFMSPDPVFFQAEMLTDPQRFNQYAYVRNNPLALLDPKGEAIELTCGSSDADACAAERQKEIQALQQAVGIQAGSYLYENPVTTTDANGNSTTQYYVGVYTNGPSGQGPAFGTINSASEAIGNIISDSRVAELNLAPAGTTVRDNEGNSTVIGPIPNGPGANSAPGATYIGQDGKMHVTLLDTSTTSPGQLPADYMSNGQPGVVDAGILAGHEMGHVRYEWGGFWRHALDSNNASAVRLENDVRMLQDPAAATRTQH